MRTLSSYRIQVSQSIIEQLSRNKGNQFDYCRICETRVFMLKDIHEFVRIYSCRILCQLLLFNNWFIRCVTYVKHERIRTANNSYENSIWIHEIDSFWFVKQYRVLSIVVFDVIVNCTCLRQVHSTTKKKKEWSANNCQCWTSSCSFDWNLSFVSCSSNENSLDCCRVSISVIIVEYLFLFLSMMLFSSHVRVYRVTSDEPHSQHFIIYLRCLSCLAALVSCTAPLKILLMSLSCIQFPRRAAFGIVID
jgi:hypothetical protein